MLDPLKVDGATIAAPQLPPAWSRAATITVSYGHGIAEAPFQFAAAAATVLNNGKRVQPTFLRKLETGEADTKPLITATTSRQMAQLMRLNVTSPEGTGRQADVPGYRVGGKTGTADVPDRGGYASKSVISSFLGAFPMDDPHYLTFVILFEPKIGTGSGHTAGMNAAPVTGRLIARIAGELGVMPVSTVASQ
jgi:cell division protein FtsI (penicillin-binding protein 3)